MFHFIVHASLTEFIFWIFILLLAISFIYVALKNKVKGLFGKEKYKNNDETLEYKNLQKVDDEIKDLENRIGKK